MAVGDRDTAMNVFVEIYMFISGFLAFLEVYVLGKCLFKCLPDHFR